MTDEMYKGFRELMVSCYGSVTGPIKLQSYDQVYYLWVTNGVNEFRIDSYGVIEKKVWEQV